MVEPCIDVVVGVHPEIYGNNGAGVDPGSEYATKGGCSR